MARIALIFFCLGMGCYFMSVVFRIQHWPMAGFLRLLALGNLGLAFLLFLIAVVRNKGINGLLDDSPENDEGGR